MNSKTSIYLQITDAGVKRVKVVADSAEETAAAHALLKKLAFEIRALNQAAKDAGSDK